MPSVPPFVPFDPLWEGASIPQEHWHFHRRLLERYGIVLRPGEYARLHKKAVVKKQKAFCRTGNTRVHRIFLHGVQEIVFVVVDDRSLISVLKPADARRQRERQLKRLCSIEAEA